MRIALRISLLLSLVIELCAVAASDIAAEVEYFYAKDGTIIGRAVNGVRSNFEYDAKGQLLAVRDAKTGELREKYTYDPAGNILSKTVYGKTTTYTYDGANQLINANTHDTKTSYAYDAAGRLIRAGNKSYRYGFKDKVLEVRDGAKTRAMFSYYMDGQLKQAKYADRTESFMWDGLALVKRDSVNFINEPHVTGGNPVLAGNSVMFNDMLGSTLAVDGRQVDMTAFGDSDDPAAMFTGKPQVEELGHVFLFRNYRAELGKWQTADPLGYPDGWNQLAYCNNGVLSRIDLLGFNLYELLDIQAVGGKGHSLPIATAQNSDGTWRATGYDYGSISSGSITTRDVRTFNGNSEQEALARAVGHYDPNGNKYDNMYKWNANNQESINAMNAMESEVQLPYVARSHNCLDITKSGLNAAGKYLYDPEFRPSYVTEMRRNSFDVTDLLKRIQE